MPETMLIFQQMVQNQYEPYSLATRARNAASSGPNPASADAASPGVQILAERAMLRLQYLQEMLEETRAELRRIELIIHAELSNSEKIA
jgi:hypothetical protein